MPSTGKLQLKKSSVITDGIPKAPAATDLDYGELAINYASGLLYYKTATNTIGILANAAAIPSTTSQTNWNTAYTERLQWDGGSTNLVAATGRTSLGATTIGGNLFTLANPSAITFPRFNEDNTVAALSASDFRTAIDVPSTSHTHSYLPLSGGTLSGTLTHGGLSPSTGTGIDQIYTHQENIILTTSWQDTGVNAAELVSGSYIVQVTSVSDYTVGGTQYQEYYTGIMSWFGDNTNSEVTDEIILHRAGHAPNSGTIFLRVQRTPGANTDDLKLQVAGTTNNTAAYQYTFKFRRLI